MDLERYGFSVNETFLDYEFVSEGPKGNIRKVIRYRPLNANDLTFFNLGFGELNPRTEMIDDFTVSNNADKDKILATVAASVLEFTKHFPDVLVYATGSTPSRTRLYQMGISANFEKIDPLFHIFGFEKINGWQPFQKGINYLAFLAKRK